MRPLGITAAALLVMLGIGLGVYVSSGVEEAEAHTCSAVDKRFIQTAGTNMTAFTLWSDGFRTGDLGADEVAQEADDAARRVEYVKPHDPSLKLSQRLIDGMFREYGQAVSLAAKERERAGIHMHRAYGLADFAREVLLEAQPELSKRGCDVAPLL
jgi:hypothetical protein